MDTNTIAQAPLSATPEKNVFSVWYDKLVNRLTHGDLGLVLFVFFLGFIVRAHLMRYELFFEFDSYWHARMVSYILQGLPAPAVDPLAYYQNVAAATFGSAPYFFWYVSAGIYKLFTLNAGYDLEAWILLVKILPALYGALITGAMYYLGKELFKGPHEKEAGLLAGIFATIIPAFVYRTMGGFFEDDSFGFLWMAIGFIFFVRATRQGTFSFENKLNSVLAGISFALMALSWSAFNMLVPILLGVGVVEFLLWMREGEYYRAKYFCYTWLVSFVLLAVGATIQTKLFWLDQFGGAIGNLLLGNSEMIRAPHVAAFILCTLILVSLFWKTVRLGKISPRIIRLVTNAVILIIVLAPLLVFLFNISLRTGDVLGQTVGEESEGRGFFGNKYSFMVLFAIIGLPACGYLLLKRARQYAFIALPLIWMVLTFFMAWGKLKFTYYWGLPLSLMCCVVCILMIKWSSSHSNRTKKIAAVFIGFSVLAGVAAGTVFVTQNVPNIELSPGWKTALFWANNNLPANAKFLNWWDEGHWISFLSNRKVLIDNRNADSAASADVAKFILSRDENDASAIIEKYGSTHLIFGDDLLSKQSSLGYYAYGSSSLSDSRLQGMLGVVHACVRRTESLTHEEKYACGQNLLTIQEYESLPTQWQSAPNNNQQGTPFHIYRDAENKHLYAFSSSTNQTFLIRMWMGDSAITHFTEIYRNAEGVRIYSYEPEKFE